MTRKKKMGRPKRNEFNPSEWGFPKPSTTKWPKSKRLEYLKKEAEEKGPYSLFGHFMDYAEMMGVGRTTIFNDVHELYEIGVKPDSVNKAKVDIHMTLDANFKRLRRIAENARTPKDQIMATKALNDTISQMTDFLERFGLKKQTPEELSHKMEVVWVKPEEDSEDGDDNPGD